MTRRRKLYSFWIDPDQAVALKRVKARDGIPESEQIRRAIDAWLASKGVAVIQAKPRQRRRQR